MSLAWPFLQFDGHRYDGPAPVALVSVRSAAVSHLAGCSVCLFALAVTPAHGAADRTAPAVHLREKLLILCGLGAGSHDAVAGQLHGQFRRRLFLSVR